MRSEISAIRDGRGGSSRNQPQTETPSRRAFVKATSASVVAASFGTSVVGAASASEPELPPLARDGNTIVDPSCREVILRGVNVADPARQSRSWRGQTALETFDRATDEEAGWYNRIIRVPCQPQDIAAGTADSSPVDMPHGDEWGPVLPGAFDRDDLEWYCERFLDPLVERGRERGVYVMVDYHRHYPVFHQADHVGDNPNGERWECSADPDEEWQESNVCGERGVLWHGADQRDDIWRVIENHDLLELFSLEEADVYLEPPEISIALDEEVRLFWEVVADRYAGDDHVVFDVYSEPTGPYAGDWAEVTRLHYETGPDFPTEADESSDPRVERNKVWWDLWRERAQPWVDTVEEHAPGHLVTIGSPRWSQYTYWAPYNEFEAENMCYSAHVFTQDDLRPLSEYVGHPAERVPVFCSEFGWKGYETGVQTPWMDGERDEYAEEFETLFEEYPIHPLAWCFDNAWDPAFFDDDWVLRDADESPGRWWKSYLEDKAGDRDDPASGTEPCPDADNDNNPAHVGPEPIEPVVGENLPRDLDDDGRYRDVTGDGEVGTTDVVVLFENLEEPAVADYPEYYDFADTGVVTTTDVVALFETL